MKKEKLAVQAGSFFDVLGAVGGLCGFLLLLFTYPNEVALFCSWAVFPATFAIVAFCFLKMPKSKAIVATTITAFGLILILLLFSGVPRTYSRVDQVEVDSNKIMAFSKNGNTLWAHPIEGISLERDRVVQLASLPFCWPELLFYNFMPNRQRIIYETFYEKECKSFLRILDGNQAPFREIDMAKDCPGSWYYAKEKTVNGRLYVWGNKVVDKGIDVVMPKMYSIRYVRVQDVDGDNEDDIVTYANSLDGFPGRLSVWSLSGEEKATCWNYGHICDILVIDLDGDKYLDIVYQGFNNKPGDICDEINMSYASDKNHTNHSCLGILYGKSFLTSKSRHVVIQSPPYNEQDKNVPIEPPDVFLLFTGDTRSYHVQTGGHWFHILSREDRVNEDDKGNITGTYMISMDYFNCDPEKKPVLSSAKLICDRGFTWFYVVGGDNKRYKLPDKPFIFKYLNGKNK